MTTETMGRSYPTIRKWVRISLVLIGIVAGWIGSMAGIMWLTEIAPTSIVIVSDVRILESLSVDVKLVRSGEHTLILTSEKSGYVSRLYKAGAWLVLPSLRNGCLDIPRTRNKDKFS